MSWFLGFLAGLFVGWVFAHQTVANECVKVGAFYAGDRVFKCTEVKP